jgi:small subunit ribosomal protein S13
LAKDSEFKYIVRIAETDIPGEQKLAYALPSIKGIGQRISNALITQLKLDPVRPAGELDDENVVRLEEAIRAAAGSVPTWLTNRQRDYDSGEDMHQVSIELKMTQEEDINRLKKIKCYRGVRHASGHKVRGQRTYSNGRHGLALGVSRKKILQAKK